jgi:hypothetical protein
MSDGTRQHPRVEYRAHVLLLGAPAGPDTRPLVGRSLNLSAGGVLVEADEPLEVGTALACLIPLGGHTRTLSSRVVRVQALEHDHVGIGLMFVDLTVADRALLDGVVAGADAPSEVVSVRFAGVSQPLQARAVLTPEGVELRTALPFLRIDSAVEVSFTVGGGRLLRHGILRDVRVDRSPRTGAPFLAVSVTLRVDEVDESDEEPTPTSTPTRGWRGG